MGLCFEYNFEIRSFYSRVRERYRDYAVLLGGFYTWPLKDREMKSEFDFVAQYRRRAIKTLVFVVCLHFLLDIIYRPMQFTGGFLDLGFAGSFTQITAIVGIAMLMVILEAVKQPHASIIKRQPYFYIFVPFIAMLTYEFLQIWYPIATFDAVDLLYCLVALLVNFIVVRFYVLH